MVEQLDFRTNLWYITGSPQMSETVSKRKYAPELREKAFKLYCEEITFATISERWDVPVKVLHRWSCDNQWKQRRENPRRTDQIGRVMRRSRETARPS